MIVTCNKYLTTSNSVNSWVVFLFTGTTTDVICKNNDEDFNNENQKDNSNVDTLVTRLMVTVEEQKRAKDFVELIEGKL